jgi:hypothetical protein
MRAFGISEATTAGSIIAIEIARTESAGAGA